MSTTIKDKTICFTGALSTQTRAQASKTAKGYGAKVGSTVTGKTNILVCGAGTEGTSKLIQAQSKGVEIWTEAQFNTAVGADVNTSASTTTPTMSDGGGGKKKKAASLDVVGSSTPPPKKKARKTTTTTTTKKEAPAAVKKGATAKKPAAAKNPTAVKKEVVAKKLAVVKKESAAKKIPAAKKGATAKKVKIEADTKAEKPPPSTPPPPGNKVSYAPATPGTPSSSGRRKPMTIIPNSSAYTVVDDYDVKLMLSDSVSMNSNKFYKVQLLRHTTDDTFFIATTWGRLGEVGKHQLKGGQPDQQKSIKDFCKVFRSKTQNAWGTRPFVRIDGKYQIVETTVGDDASGDGTAALGRLTEEQINQGQKVLADIRSVLETENAKKPSKTRKPPVHVLGKLSNDFYSLIPTSSGRQRPPPLDNLEIVTEKEGLLEFWLRMGFEELGDGDIDGSPIEGVFELPIPKTLTAAASGIANSGSITSSTIRGKQLAKGGAVSMGAELYSAILLYTGNSIYSELNRCLRSDWNSVRKYWNYLRLYFEAMDAMESKATTLYRGIAVDLYDEYEPGKVITWWSVSSCTASKSVAQNFMNQLGGSAATFLTLKTKKACDVSSLSFYPHEAESLLRPGTRLRVLKRNRKGKVVEIEVEEVLEDDV